MSSNDGNLAKLDEIIDLFKLEKEICERRFQLHKDELNTDHNMIVSGIAISISTITAAYNILTFFYGSSSFIGVMILAFIVGVLIIFPIYSIFTSREKNKRLKEYIEFSVRISVILEALQIIKISGTSFNLAPIVNVIKRRYDYSSYLFGDYDKIWLDDVIMAVDVVFRNAKNSQQ